VQIFQELLSAFFSKKLVKSDLIFKNSKTFKESNIQSFRSLLVSKNQSKGLISMINSPKNKKNHAECNRGKLLVQPLRW
jgi:hypothetical protein